MTPVLKVAAANAAAGKAEHRPLAFMYVAVEQFHRVGDAVQLFTKSVLQKHSVNQNRLLGGNLRRSQTHFDLRFALARAAVEINADAPKLRQPVIEHAHRLQTQTDAIGALFGEFRLFDDVVKSLQQRIAQRLAKRQVFGDGARAGIATVTLIAGLRPRACVFETPIEQIRVAVEQISFDVGGNGVFIGEYLFAQSDGVAQIVGSELAVRQRRRRLGGELRLLIRELQEFLALLLDYFP